MPVWDPAQYARFADHRLRPAQDLLARVPPGERGRIVDLGCGAGQVTRLLRERWPAAEITGVDSSPTMLERASAEVSAAYVGADVGGWRPPMPVDLIISNATLQWLPDHGRLLVDLVRHLTPGGVLAVQMGANHAARSHKLIAEVAADGPWAVALAGIGGIVPVEPARHYAALLLPCVAAVDAWATVYEHVLEGGDPVLEWVKGTTLRPYLDALGPEAEPFVETYRAHVRAAYPPEPDGRTLYGFRRVFVVAIR